MVDLWPTSTHRRLGGGSRASQRHITGFSACRCMLFVAMFQIKHRGRNLWLQRLFIVVTVTFFKPYGAWTCRRSLGEHQNCMRDAFSSEKKTLLLSSDIIRNISNVRVTTTKHQILQQKEPPGCVLRKCLLEEQKITVGGVWTVAVFQASKKNAKIRAFLENRNRKYGCNSQRHSRLKLNSDLMLFH